MTTRTEGFRLVSLLIVIALCAIALFAGFHALATTPQARVEQSGIVLDASPSAVDSSQSALPPGAQDQKPDTPTADATAPVEPTAPVHNDVAPEPTPAPAPVVVSPAPPVDLDDDVDDDYDTDTDHDDIDDDIND